MKVILLLVLVIVLIWVCLGLLRRAMGMRGGGNNGVIMAGGVPLGQRKSIQFIKIGSTLYLVGVTDHHISLIDTVEDEDKIEDIINIRTPSNKQLFSTMLKKVTGKLSNQNAA
ncbi:flagellar biosynthetic protein FliO [bacterium]|nr:flagellar biosynthetic protein FliO [bacterium]